MSDELAPSRADMSRRQALGKLGATAVATSLLGGALVPEVASAAEVALPRTPTGHGRLHQSVSRWCYGKIPLDELCRAAQAMHIEAIDLLDEADWKVPQNYRMVCAMANGFGTIPKGFNRPDLHDELVAKGSAMIPKAAAAGVERIVCFSGNRGGMSDGEGIANCIAGFKRLMPVAEKHNVTLCLELLNSKVDHKDYHCDHTDWGVEVVKGVNSPRLRLLYDIYHMQIMEGNVVATIKANMPYIAHFHTGGVPGRGDIDDTQELNYRLVAETIADLRFEGYVAHEFVPKLKDPLESLRNAVVLCEV